MSSPRSRGQRAGLARSTVLAEARDLLGERGLDGLTMRALSGRLGVQPNALYSHVASKTELIDVLLDDVLDEVRPPKTNVADPIAGLHALMSATYRVLLRHSDLVPLYLQRQGANGRHAQALGEIVLALLARVGVTGRRAIEARRVLIVFTIGFAAFSPADNNSDVPVAETAGNFRHGLSWLLAGITNS